MCWLRATRRVGHVLNRTRTRLITVLSKHLDASRIRRNVELTSVELSVGEDKDRLWRAVPCCNHRLLRLRSIFPHICTCSQIWFQMSSEIRGWKINCLPCKCHCLPSNVSSYLSSRSPTVS
ncbi:hypothetical protein YC2023_030459 [Brassica napus]